MSLQAKTLCRLIGKKVKKEKKVGLSSKIECFLLRNNSVLTPILWNTTACNTNGPQTVGMNHSPLGLFNRKHSLYLFPSHFLGVAFDCTEERALQALCGTSLTLLLTHVTSAFSLATLGCSLQTLLWFHGKRVELLWVSLKEQKQIVI